MPQSSKLEEKAGDGDCLMLRRREEEERERECLPELSGATAVVVSGEIYRQERAPGERL